MHEGAICSEIIDIVSGAAEENDIKNILEIDLCVGPYSCINAEQLNFYFDIARKGTCMSDAVILIQKDDSLTGASQMYIKSFRGE